MAKPGHPSTSMAMVGPDLFPDEGITAEIFPRIISMSPLKANLIGNRSLNRKVSKLLDFQTSSLFGLWCFLLKYE